MQTKGFLQRLRWDPKTLEEYSKIIEDQLNAGIIEVVEQSDSKYIEKAFLMISMSPEDRDVLCFLWVDNPHNSSPNIVVYRFPRVVFGVSSLLNSTIQHHLKQYSSSHPELVAKLLESFYVDDLVCRSNNEEEAYEHYTFAKEASSQALLSLPLTPRR